MFHLYVYEMYLKVTGSMDILNVLTFKMMAM